MKRNRIQFPKHYRYFMLTYLVVMIVPLLISFLGYMYFYHTIEQDTYLYHNTTLNQEKIIYDKIFSIVLSNIKTISNNSVVNKLMKKEEWAGEELFEVVQLNFELKKLIGDDSNVESSIGVYFYDNNSFVTNENRYAKPVIPVYLKRYNLSLEDFLNRANFISGYFLIHNEKEQFIIFYRNMYNQTYTEPEALVFAVVPWGKLKEIADAAVLLDQGGTVLINSKDQVIGNSNPNIDISNIQYSLFSNDHDMYSMELGNNSYIISSLQSDIIDVKYCIYTPRSVFYRKMNFMKGSIIIELMLCIIVGIFVANYFTGKNYGPIERILSLLDMRQDELQNASTTQNYELLENTLKSLFQNKSSLEKQVYMRDNWITEKVLSAMLKGQILNEDWSIEYEKSLQHIVNFSRYRIVLFSFEDLENSIILSKQIEAEGNISTYSLLLFVIKNVIDEAVLFKNRKSQKNGITIEIDDMVACIVPFSGEEKDETLVENVQLCINFLKEIFQLSSYAAISGIHCNWNDLPIAYEEAMLSITHKSFWENVLEDIIMFDNELLQQPIQSNERLLLEQAMKLSNCLATREYKQASTMLDDILESCFSKDIRNLIFNQSQAIFIVGMILNNLENFSLDQGEFTALFSSLNYPEHFLRVKSLRSLKKEIHKILEEIAVKYEEKIKSEEPDWLQKVKAYVDENYCNPDLNVTIIADRFNMTLSHMGKMYRKFTGISMLDHIHALRIAKCKSLLIEGKSIKDCAKETGYIDSKGLIRAFKRYEGITPGQFKSNIGNTGQK